MAIVFETLSLAGLRKTHLEQLLSYIQQRDIDGWYYGNKKQFEARHQDLLRWISMAVYYANEEGIVFPRKYFDDNLLSNELDKKE
jgi:hypothetical protein